MIIVDSPWSSMIIHDCHFRKIATVSHFRLVFIFFTFLLSFSCSLAWLQAVTRNLHNVIHLTLDCKLIWGFSDQHQRLQRLIFIVQGFCSPTPCQVRMNRNIFFLKRLFDKQKFVHNSKRNEDEYLTYLTVRRYLRWYLTLHLGDIYIIEKISHLKLFLINLKS